MSAAHPVVQCHVCDTKRSLGLECLYVESGNRHFIPWDLILHPREWECTVPCFFRKDFHHHGQLPSLLSNGKFLLPGDGVLTSPPILANRSILVPAKHLPPRGSFIGFTLVQQTNSRLDVFKCCGAFHWAAPLPVFPKFPKAFSPACFYLRFWGGLALGLGYWLLFLEKKKWWRQCRMSSQSCFVEISLTGDVSVSPRLRASPAVPSNLDFLQSLGPWP